MSAEDFEYLLEELEENNVYENAIEQMMDELVDEVTLGLCFEVHRSVKKGTFFLDDNEKEKEDQFKIVIERGLDIFGQVPIKAKQVECVCPNCSRNLAASRFAPHLEKCMGMGRTSSRVASRRIARVGKKESDEDSDKEDEDDDWTFVPEKRTFTAKKIKKDKHGHKSSPKGRVKHKNGDVSSISGSSEAPTYESLSISERKDVLKNTCGVISEHTKKMCTRSLRCPQHSDDQRKAVRLFLLRSPPGLTSNVLYDEATIDIDTYDVSESKTMRDCLTWEASSNQPSPADSSSTTNSGSSFRKKTKTSKKRKSKTSSASGRNSNLDSRSNTNTPTKLYDFE